jgi:hypothetical protein
VIDYKHIMRNDKATYTLWDGSKLLHTYPHTREGYDAALAQAFEYGGHWLKIFSSRDDLVWSASDEQDDDANDFAEMDDIYDESGEYDINSLFYND